MVLASPRAPYYQRRRRVLPGRRRGNGVPPPGTSIRVDTRPTIRVTRAGSSPCPVITRTAAATVAWSKGAGTARWAVRASDGKKVLLSASRSIAFGPGNKRFPAGARFGPSGTQAGRTDGFKNFRRICGSAAGGRSSSTPGPRAPGTNGNRHLEHTAIVIPRPGTRRAAAGRSRGEAGRPAPAAVAAWLGSPGRSGAGCRSFGHAACSPRCRRSSPRRIRG